MGHLFGDEWISGKGSFHISDRVAYCRRRWSSFGAGGTAEALGRRGWAIADVASPVTWAAPNLQAREHAIEACKKVAKTCAGNPATTIRLDDVFAHMRCTKPRHGCAAVAASPGRSCRSRIEALFVAAGYRICSVRHYMSAADGAQLDEEEAVPKEKTKRGRFARATARFRS